MVGRAVMAYKATGKRCSTSGVYLNLHAVVIERYGYRVKAGRR